MQLVNGHIRLSATDLANYLGCRHLTWLDQEVAHGRRARPTYRDPTLESLAERGQRHEDAYIEHLKRQGLRVEKLERGDAVRNREQTLAFMREGVDVIVQPVMTEEGWLGYADFLVRVQGESALGDFSYEVQDTKLSRTTKAGAVLQLALYSDILEGMQGRRPEHMHVVAPGSGDVPFAIDVLRFNDYRAYYTSVRARLERGVMSTLQSQGVPEPIAKCESCRWVFECEAERRRVDHLSFVARSTRGQREELGRREIETLTALAKAPLPFAWTPDRGSKESLVRLREQARLQHASRDSAAPLHERIACAADEGLGRLPEPCGGDIFLDFEGDPFVRDGGLEYLFGYVSKEGFVGHWAFDRAQEKAVFEKFVDDVMVRWAAWPDMHVYHFAPYEPAAMRRLMMRHGTRVQEVDAMLRAGLFVDLFAVVREGLRVGVESYSIKRLEPCFGFDRELALVDVGPRKRALEAALELTDEPERHIEQEWLDVVLTYNRHDCESAMRLRDWLESLRDPMAPRPSPHQEEVKPESDDAREGRELRQQLEERAASLSAGADRDAVLLLASLVEFHRREAKVIWWELFRLRDLSLDELHDEAHALAGLELLPREAGDHKALERYRYPHQEIDVRDGDSVYRFEDASGEMEQGGNVKDAGKVVSVDRGRRIITIKRVAKRMELPLTNVYFHNFVNAGAIQDALTAFANNPNDAKFTAASHLLHRHAPNMEDATADETPLAYAIRVAKGLGGGVLPIQGPPGAGKTYTASHVIVALVAAGYKVGVTATSHKVITHLMNGVVKASRDAGASVRCLQKVKEKPENRDGVDEVDDDAIYDAIADGTHDVFGGTAWCWTSTKLPHQLDYLFVDEAGQFSLANALAVATAAKNVVLVGDPRQLEQPQRGAHPEGAGISALQHLLGEHRTIPNDRGIFLAETWRLDPAICEFTSAAFYSGRLQSAKRDAGRDIRAGVLQQCGLYTMIVPHAGCGNASPLEASAIASLVESITAPGATWTDADGQTGPLTREHIKIVAPYNVQVAVLRETLGPDIEIGTVDKFQGQEAAVVIVSMTSSTVADAPRGFEFLLSPNRLNVATSRGKCACVVVASPQLFDVECRTPEQMRFANALCEYDQRAQRI